MKKADYIKKTTDNLSTTTRIGASAVLTAFILMLVIGWLTLRPKPLLTNNQIPNLIICSILFLVSIILFARFFFLISSRYYNRCLKRRKDELLKGEKKIKNFQHQHEAISQRIAALLQYYHKDQKTMDKLNKFLEKENFSYVLKPFLFLAIFDSERQPSFDAIIGDNVRELLGHIKAIGWGDYADRLRGSIKIKIHAEENRILQIIEKKIKSEIDLIDSLED
ncbi:MAG: hypothetical protein PHG95_00290 [Patescibacteria group bacterium]|nr:hypothetical protein [Patescibacteria group bacterium]